MGVNPDVVHEGKLVGDILNSTLYVQMNKFQELRLTKHDKYNVFSGSGTETRMNFSCYCIPKSLFTELSITGLLASVWGHTSLVYQFKMLATAHAYDSISFERAMHVKFSLHAHL